MTVAEAAAQWEEAKRAVKAAEPKLKAAEKVLKEHFRKTGRSTYKDRIAYSCVPTTRLDATLARAALGEKAAACEVAGERETLSLLKP